MEEIPLPNKPRDGDTNGHGPDVFNTLVIIEFKLTINPACVEWFMSKIEATRSNDGAELLAHIATDEDGRVCVYNFLSALIIQKNQWYHQKVLLKSFPMNGHVSRFQH
jgi:hypothetical protein